LDSSQYQKTINNVDLDVSRGLKWSLGLHVFVLIFFVLKNAFFTGESLIYESAIRVDLVGLPEKIDPKALTAEPAPTPPAPAPPVKEEAPPPPAEKKLPEKINKPDTEAINLAQAKKKQQEALNRLKSMSAIDQIKKDIESEKKAKEASAAAQKATPVKGNVLSAGTELTGLNKLQHENYVGLIDRQIKDNWSLPEWLAKKDYKAQVLLKIDERGTVIFRQIVKSSGNPNYDDVVLDTIDKSAPYPPPPEKLIAIVGNRGLLIGFPE